jgi:AsmA protein
MPRIESSLYDGTLKGSGFLDVRRETPAYHWSHYITGMQIGPFLRDLHGHESLTGLMQSGATLDTSGRSTMDLRRNLKGKVDFKVSDGAISDVNVSQLLRDGIRKVKGLSPGPQEPPRTVFSVLSASGTITRGVETTPDLLLIAPRFRVTGNGQTDLVREVLDFRLLIELAGSEGQFDEGSLGLSSVPVRVSGPVRQPTISPDMESVLRDLGLRGGQAVQEVIKGVGSGLNKGVEGLKNLFK